MIEKSFYTMLSVAISCIIGTEIWFVVSLFTSNEQVKATIIGWVCGMLYYAFNSRVYEKIEKRDHERG